MEHLLDPMHGTFLHRESHSMSGHWAVLEQDREMLETMAADADQAENLYQHDLGVVRLRRLYRNLAEEQAPSAAGW
jgi:phenylpropionate dioxygenase-like ring-hydroxylating dioxygenase large terminal subunit